MDELQVDVDQREADGRKICFVTANGAVDLATTERLRVALDSPQCEGSAGVLLDVREVSFMDSSGLAAVLNTANQRGASFAMVVAADSAVAKLFDITDSNRYVNSVATPEAGLAALRDGG